MNTLVLLLATCAPAADAVPEAPSPVTQCGWRSNDQGTAPASRPRFFGRLRGMFNHKSNNSGTPASPAQGTQAPYASYQAPAGNYAGMNATARPVYSPQPTVGNPVVMPQTGAPGRLVATPVPGAVQMVPTTPGRIIATPATRPVFTSEPPLAAPESAPPRPLPVGKPNID